MIKFENVINNEVAEAALMVSIFGVPTMDATKGSSLMMQILHGDL